MLPWDVEADPEKSPLSASCTEVSQRRNVNSLDGLAYTRASLGVLWAAWEPLLLNEPPTARHCIPSRRDAGLVRTSVREWTGVCLTDAGCDFRGALRISKLHLGLERYFAPRSGDEQSVLSAMACCEGVPLGLAAHQTRGLSMRLPIVNIWGTANGETGDGARESNQVMMFIPMVIHRHADRNPHLYPHHLPPPNNSKHVSSGMLSGLLAAPAGARRSSTAPISGTHSGTASRSRATINRPGLCGAYRASCRMPHPAVSRETSQLLWPITAAATFDA